MTHSNESLGNQSISSLVILYLSNYQKSRKKNPLTGKIFKKKKINNKSRVTSIIEG